MRVPLPAARPRRGERSRASGPARALASDTAAQRDTSARRRRPAPGIVSPGPGTWGARSEGMAQTVSDHIIQRLYAWGVRMIYGYPGDGINGLMGAIERSEGRIRFLQPRHEASAAFMACGHAKFTGQIGVCMATSGPGAIHLLNGLYDAQMDHQPVLAIVGQQARTALGGQYQQEVDLLSLFKDVAGEYVHMATEPAQVRQLIDRAVRIAKAERCVTCLIFPGDLQT